MKPIDSRRRIAHIVTRVFGRSDLRLDSKSDRRRVGGKHTPPPLRSRSFLELQANAVRQWETIERHRRSLVPVTFGA
jgi:hypothetical protein